jgi:hypothetical protein
LRTYIPPDLSEISSEEDFNAIFRLVLFIVVATTVKPAQSATPDAPEITPHFAAFLAKTKRLTFAVSLKLAELNYVRRSSLPRTPERLKAADYQP